MTDAERWRHIAETKAWGAVGLCYAVRWSGTVGTAETRQIRRMQRALRTFAPEGISWSAHWWPLFGKGDTERTYACLLLAAMAEADGGNHKETTP